MKFWRMIWRSLIRTCVELKKSTSPKHLNDEDEPNILVEVKEALMALPVELLGSMNVPFLFVEMMEATMILIPGLPHHR